MGNTSKIVGRLLLEESVSDAEAAKLLGFDVEEERKDTECCDDSCGGWIETEDDDEDLYEDEDEFTMKSSCTLRKKNEEWVSEGAFVDHSDVVEDGYAKKSFDWSEGMVSKEDVDAWFEDLRARDTGRKADPDKELFDSIGFQKFMYERMLAKLRNRPVDDTIKESAEDMLKKSIKSFEETMNNINASETGPYVSSFTRMNLERRERVEREKQEERVLSEARKKAREFDDKFLDLQDEVDDAFLNLSFEEVYAFIFDRIVNKFAVVFSDLWLAGDENYGLHLEDTVNQLIDYLDHRVSLIVTHPKEDLAPADKTEVEPEGPVDLQAAKADVRDIDSIRDELAKQKVREHQEKLEAEKEADRLWRKGVDEFIKQKQQEQGPFNYPLVNPLPYPVTIPSTEPLPYTPYWPYPYTGKPWPQAPGIGTPYVPGIGTAPAWNPPYIVTCTACANGGVCNCILNGQFTCNSDQR